MVLAVLAVPGGRECRSAGQLSEEQDQSEGGEQAFQGEESGLAEQIVRLTSRGQSQPEGSSVLPLEVRNECCFRKTRERLSGQSQPVAGYGCYSQGYFALRWKSQP